MTTVNIQSFGYLHDAPEDATVVLDVRDLLRDPHVDPAMRELTGLDQAVYEHVLATPGAAEVLDRLYGLTATLLRLAGPLGAPLTVAIGCAGGRHRSVALAVELGRRLADAGHAVSVRHRDIERAVVRR